MLVPLTVKSNAPVVVRGVWAGAIKDTATTALNAIMTTTTETIAAIFLFILISPEPSQISLELNVSRHLVDITIIISSIRSQIHQSIFSPNLALETTVTLAQGLPYTRHTLEISGSDRNKINLRSCVFSDLDFFVF